MNPLLPWGPNLSQPKGYIVEPGGGAFAHQFGGTGWAVENVVEGIPGPSLILTLDLTDPLLAPLAALGSSLPLCSHLNTDIWWHPQLFSIDPVQRRATMIEGGTQGIVVTDPALQFPMPLPRRDVCLRDMRANEYPIDEETYYYVWDEFFGGSAFMRVLGPTLWKLDPVIVSCRCGHTMMFAASIGSESTGRASQYLDKPFFIGEAVLHFFVCAYCMEMQVICEA